MSVHMDKNRAQNGSAPLYIQIAERLRAGIGDGRFAHNSRLPNELALAQELGVSRATVRQAMSLLVQEGLVRRRKRAGSTVIMSPPRVQYTVSSLLGFNEALRAEGLDPEVSVFSARLRSNGPLISVKLNVSRKKKKFPPMEIQEKVCKEIARIAGQEIGVGEE